MLVMILLRFMDVRYHSVSSQNWRAGTAARERGVPYRRIVSCTLTHLEPHPAQEPKLGHPWLWSLKYWYSLPVRRFPLGPFCDDTSGNRLQRPRSRYFKMAISAIAPHDPKNSVSASAVLISACYTINRLFRWCQLTNKPFRPRHFAVASFCWCME